ncbi:MAG: hypothetical protein ACC662_04650, partial [Planctomycetota bacterium]
MPRSSVHGFGLALLLVSLLLVPGRALSADGDQAAYGSTYTAEELAALDRALHAANCTREDLRFDRDRAEGRATLPLVRSLLADPLAIAPAMDRVVEGAQALAETKPRAQAWLDVAQALLEAGPAPFVPPSPSATGEVSAPFDPTKVHTPEALLDAFAEQGWGDGLP